MFNVVSSPEAVLAASEDLLDSATTFESPDETYNAIYKRSILAAYLYFDAEKGGMGAGSYNGAYFYNWPRDAVYGAVTMDKVGLHDVAENVYDWLWNIAKRDVTGNDYGSDGKYHRFWYQKYTMDGEPEWWNPQIDETAVIPWGAWYHYQQTGDSAFLTDYDDLQVWLVRKTMIIRGWTTTKVNNSCFQ